MKRWKEVNLDNKDKIDSKRIYGKPETATIRYMKILSLLTFFMSSFKIER